MAEKIVPCARGLVLLAAFTGLRWGELIRLRRHDIDLVGGLVRVSASTPEVGGVLLPDETTKSDGGKRLVGIPEAIIPDLRRHLDRWSEPGPDREREIAQALSKKIEAERPAGDLAREWHDGEGDDGGQTVSAGPAVPVSAPAALCDPARRWHGGWRQPPMGAFARPGCSCTSTTTAGRLMLRPAAVRPAS